MRAFKFIKSSQASDLFALMIIGFFLISTIVGQVRGYSPIPFWDLWNGDLEFYSIVKNHFADTKVWFSQHNEHRIVIQRLFFYVDNIAFKGKFVFLYVLNYFLVCCSLSVFVHIIFTQVKTKKLRLLTLSLVSVFLFSWMQSENFAWAFQAQFFLAYLFPILSFYSFAQYTKQKNVRSLMCSIFAALASIVSMGNGVMVFPILLSQAIYCKSGSKAIFLIILTGVIALSLHFSSYITPLNHVSALNELIFNPLRSVMFFMVFISSPIFIISDSIPITLIFSVFQILLFIVLALKVHNDPVLDRKSTALALLMIVLYEYISAFATSGARGESGYFAAASSRYTTAALTGFSSIFLLFVIYYSERISKIFLLTLVLFFCFLFTPIQVKAFKSRSDENFGKYVAVLALLDNVNDVIVLQNVFPYTDWLRSMSGNLIKERIGVFSDPVFTLKSKPSKEQANPELSVHVEKTETINSDSKYNRITGWFYCNRAEQKSEPRRADLYDESDNLVGNIIIGLRRDDVSSALKIPDKYTGFMGYIEKLRGGHHLFINDTECKTYGMLNYE